MRAHQEAEVHTLRRLWRRWTGVVETFARRRGTRRGIGEAAYAHLHQELARACQALAATGGEKAAYYERLAELARPWLSCRILQEADREIVRGVVRRCQQIDRELNGRRWSDLGRRGGRWAALVLAGAALAAVLAWDAGRGWSLLAGGLAQQWQALRLAVVQATDTQRLIVGGLVVVLVTAVLLRTSSR